MADTGRGSPSPRKAARVVGLSASSPANGDAQAVDVDRPGQVEVVGDRVDVDGGGVEGGVEVQALLQRRQRPHVVDRVVERGLDLLDRGLVELDGGEVGRREPAGPRHRGGGHERVERRPEAVGERTQIVLAETGPGRGRPRDPQHGTVGRSAPSTRSARSTTVVVSVSAWPADGADGAGVARRGARLLPDADLGAIVRRQRGGGRRVQVAEQPEATPAVGGGPPLLLDPLERGRSRRSRRVEADRVAGLEAAHRAIEPAVVGPTRRHDVDDQRPRRIGLAGVGARRRHRSVQPGEDDLLGRRPDHARRGLDRGEGQVDGHLARVARADEVVGVDAPPGADGPAGGEDREPVVQLGQPARRTPRRRPARRPTPAARWAPRPGAPRPRRPPGRRRRPGPPGRPPPAGGGSGSPRRPSRLRRPRCRARPTRPGGSRPPPGRAVRSLPPPRRRAPPVRRRSRAPPRPRRGRGRRATLRRRGSRRSSGRHRPRPVRWRRPWCRASTAPTAATSRGAGSPPPWSLSPSLAPSAPADRGRSTVRTCARGSPAPAVARHHATAGSSASGPDGAISSPAAAKAPVAGATSAARPAGVGCSNTSRSARSQPRRRARPASVMATMLSPPSEKKLSSWPTASTPRTSANRSARSPAATDGRRSAVEAARSPPPRAPSAAVGSGSALRSTFPLVVSGSSSSRTNAAGTSTSGRSASAARSDSGSSTASPPAAGTT